MGHSLRNTNLTISGSFSIQDGSEKANYILISDERGKTSWSKPNDYISANPDGHYIGELFGGGVVVAVWKEGGIEKCLIAGTENICTTAISPYDNTHFKYGFTYSSGQSVATYRSFGASNSVLISAANAGSAAKMCLDYINPNLGTGVWDDWFLPSIAELRHLMNNSAIFNKVLDRYSADTARPIIDTVVKQAVGGDGRAIQSVIPTDINLVEYVYKQTNTIFADKLVSDTGVNLGTAYRESNNSPFYWSSTQNGTSAVGYSAVPSYSGIPFEYNAAMNEEIFGVDAIAKGLVRPFRIGDDTQTSIVFDADWAVLTYVFSGEDDLDTRTTMITPYRTDSQRGYGSLEYYSWAPAGINSPSTGPIAINEPAGGIASNGTFSILWHAGDNTGQGYETVLININAFKYYFPGQAEIEIDARAHWYVGTFNPAWDFTTASLGITQRQRIDRTPPAVLKIDLYKGGTASRNPSNYFQWIVSGYSASYSVGSYGKVVNDVYPGDTIDGVPTTNQLPYPSGVRVARFKYNVVGKFGKIIID